jgi:hypothetical protein
MQQLSAIQQNIELSADADPVDGIYLQVDIRAAGSVYMGIQEQEIELAPNLKGCNIIVESLPKPDLM